jgi:hypothetical protein
MTYSNIILYSIIIIILYYVVNNINNIHNNNHFLYMGCKKGICYNHFQKCYSANGYIYSDIKTDKIERKTLKCILDKEDKYKLTKLDTIFVPSIMNGTYCDIVYTTYYDYNDFIILKNRFFNLNMPLSKCIRIRHYHFQPGIYFELKYSGGTKVRALIDNDFNLLEEDKLHDEYKEAIINMLNKIKAKTIQPIFQNTYKRLSFIYKNNPEIRITIDSNIEFFYNNIYKTMEQDVMELKIPYNVSIDVANTYIKEINMLIGTQLRFEHFSKFEYYYNSIV